MSAFFETDEYYFFVKWGIWNAPAAHLIQVLTYLKGFIGHYNLTIIFIFCLRFLQELNVAEEF